MSEGPSPQTAAVGRRYPRGVLLILVVCTVLGACCGVLFTRLKNVKGPRLYETSARVMISRTASPSDAPLPSPEFAGANPQTHALLLKSTKVVQRAVEEYRLHELTSFQNVQRYGVAAAIAEQLTTGVAAGDDKANTALIDVTYRSTNVVDAMTIAKAVIHAYRDELSEAAKKVQDEAVRLLVQARDELNAELKKQQEELRRLQKNATGDAQLAADDPKHPEQRRRRAQQERDDLDLRRVELQSLLKTGEAALKEGKSPAAIGLMLQRDPLFRNPPAPQPPATSPKGTAEKVPAEKPPVDKPAADGAGPLTGVPTEEEKSLTVMFDRVRVELSLIAEKQKSLNELIQQADRELASLRDFQIQQRSLEGEAKSTDGQYQTVLVRLNQIELAQDSASLKVEIVTPPDKAWEVRPPALKPSDVGIGAALGFLVGVIIAGFYMALTPA